MHRRYSLRQRFAVLIVALFMVMFAIVATLLVVRKANSERANLNEQAQSFATLATKPIGDTFTLYKDSGSVRIQQQIEKFTELDPDITGVSIVDITGNKQFVSGQSAAVSSEQASAFEPIYLYENGAISTAIVPLIEDFGVHRYTMVYRVSGERITHDIQRTVGLIAIFSIFGFGLAIAVTYWMVNRLFLSPLTKISNAALKITNGSLEEQVVLKRHDELGDLATAVNTMANSLKADIAKLQETDRLKTEFIIISSHNLRTPLTTMKGTIELMQEAGVPDNIRNWVDSLASAIERLDDFITELTAITTVEAGQLSSTSLTPEPVRPLLETIAAPYREAAEHKNIGFETDFQLGEDAVPMNRNMLRLALTNLLENAFKFTKEGSVHFSAERVGDTIHLKVADTGAGIAESEIPKLFTKFHRGTSVLRYDYEGTGVGLYLTKLVLTAHHGTISVQSIEGTGSTFTVTLPLAASVLTTGQHQQQPVDRPPTPADAVVPA